MLNIRLNYLVEVKDVLSLTRAESEKSSQNSLLLSSQKNESPRLAPYPVVSKSENKNTGRTLFIPEYSHIFTV